MACVLVPRNACASLLLQPHCGVLHGEKRRGWLLLTRAECLQPHCLLLYATASCAVFALAPAPCLPCRRYTGAMRLGAIQVLDTTLPLLHMAPPDCVTSASETAPATLCITCHARPPPAAQPHYSISTHGHVLPVLTASLPAPPTQDFVADRLLSLPKVRQLGPDDLPAFLRSPAMSPYHVLAVVFGRGGGGGSLALRMLAERQRDMMTFVRAHVQVGGVRMWGAREGSGGHTRGAGTGLRVSAATWCTRE